MHGFIQAFIIYVLPPRSIKIYPFYQNFQVEGVMKTSFLNSPESTLAKYRRKKEVSNSILFTQQTFWRGELDRNAISESRTSAPFFVCVCGANLSSAFRSLQNLLCNTIRYKIHPLCHHHPLHSAQKGRFCHIYLFFTFPPLNIPS